ncbi:hypothetical protein T440DRAFT_523327 [Plenodomus tracheiphilus IPT5]|uniref:Fork-head domain-containing protein n=1 Tax=Plenodomus tracheiphilus IPT5 TaxID=1408161 RepID=A0A6A7AR09_9PLEO|nr:hypothetical protein T440DRAFT_523327 [Plenodomus tracheiphilus IPT5]
MSYNDNYNLSYSTQYPESSCPRSYNGIDVTGLPANGSSSQAYPPEAYQIDPPKHLENMDLSDQEGNGRLMEMSNDYEQHPCNSHIKIEDNTGYQSPYSTMTRASTPQDCGSPFLQGGDTGSDVTIDKEQPYAQLIYQALLHAEGHTMILRDIYDWFKKYTDKAAASETKGWQNSIRHNLSMNGAFEKVDQPGEESRKGFMWRLSASALREGVKSTTRYRSKAPNKRNHRSHFPQPQRQASGSKGGQAARRSVRMRRSNRMHMQQEYRSDPYANRSVPAAFDPMAQFGGVGGGTRRYPGENMNYNSAGTEDMDFGYHNHATTMHKDTTMSDFSSPLPTCPSIDIFAASRPYTGALMPQHLPTHTSHPLSNSQHASQPTSQPLSELNIMHAAPDYLFDHSPTDSLFTDSPSPGSMDEPLTPEGSDGSAGVWSEDLGLGLAEWEGLTGYTG